MAEYVNLEKEVYDTIRAKPFMKNPSKLTWAQKEVLIEETSEIALNCNMSYDWDGDYELLAKIEGATQYLGTVGENYVISSKPNDINSDVLVNRTTQLRVKVLQVRRIVRKRDWAVVLGF